MSKQVFSREYEINASPKILFQYLNTPSGLAKWFADAVIEEDDKNYVFIWDEQKHRARKVGRKENQYVKYEFASQSGEDQEEPFYLEFFLEVNQFTNTTFLKIHDFGDIDDINDYQELYNHMINSLNEIVGGSNLG